MYHTPAPIRADDARELEQPAIAAGRAHGLADARAYYAERSDRGRESIQNAAEAYARTGFPADDAFREACRLHWLLLGAVL